MWTVAIFAALAFGMVPWSNRIGAELLHYENVYVIRPVDDYSYWLRINGTATYAVFCRDVAEPQFDAGETIRVLNVRDYGACWSYKDTHPAYLMLRDEQGNLIRHDD